MEEDTEVDQDNRMEYFPLEKSAEIEEQTSYTQHMEGEDEETLVDGSFWDQVPDDIILHIFSFLDCNSLLECSKTCKSWCRISADESLWKYLTSYKVGIPCSSLPPCDCWFSEYKRLVMNVPIIESEALQEHTDEVYHVIFSPSGRFFSSTGKDGMVVVWELGNPTRMYTKTQVVTEPSYTRFSEFNQSETKLLVAGMDFYNNGFIKIYQFGKELVELCKIQVEFPNFRGAWLSDNHFVSMRRCNDSLNGQYLKVCAYKAEKGALPFLFYEAGAIKNSMHRNDMVRCVNKSLWKEENRLKTVNENPQKHSEEGGESTMEQCCGKKVCGESNEVTSKGNCSLVINQTSIDFECALFQYQLDNDYTKQRLENQILNAESDYTNPRRREFLEPQALHKSPCTVIGTNLSGDHRYFVYGIREKTENYMHAQTIDVHVYDLQNDLDTGEVYSGSEAVGEDHVSYIFPSICDQFVACGSENLKGYIWDRRYRILLSVLDHESGIHSQNGVNATAFCPTDPEVLVTVADDLNVRVWRSRQRINESRLTSVIDLDCCLNDNKELDITCCSKVEFQTHCKCSKHFDLGENDLEDEMDGQVSCCSGLKFKKSKKSKE